MDQNVLPTSTSLAPALSRQYEPAVGWKNNSAMSVLDPENRRFNVADTAGHGRTTSQSESLDAGRRDHHQEIVDPQSPKPKSGGMHSQQQDSTPGQRTSFLGDIRRYIYPSGASPSQREEQSRKEIARLAALLEKRDRQIAKMQADHKNTLKNVENDFRKIQEDNRQKHHDHWERVNQEHEMTVNKLLTQLQEIGKEKEVIQMEHDRFIRENQEASFGKMESARWAPAEDSKIVGQLERLRREMRSWAKGMALKDMALLKNLEKTDQDSLMDYLSNVVALQNGQLPGGLETPKSPALLLNALFTHILYSTLFRSPFFFLEDAQNEGLNGSRVAETLVKMYEMAQNSNAHDAHTWRSDTLRLLLPPPGSSTSEGQKSLHGVTDSFIVRAADFHASSFLIGPASHLMKPDADPKQIEKCKAIFQEAARFSYQLWTRRTEVRCYGLREMGEPTFSVNNPETQPHSLLRYDNHEDLLEGRPITVVVHPLIKVYGTGAAEQYDCDRVWMRAEVWLDSR
ncbi:hypothetical protein ONS95_005687 [Cadophora gregata]|uniref:uncharacterized protein n=1 Tax=Cadophora gregata TaxID=51156 RepID=UPI0026DB85FD|nr:uncharacterized protein ONS95_005687 [Cadophora gregata]KAK0103677.1 hypothetical protein ONS95_005687 [Cadophora gregata]KAK0107868.1 hypothetical protein ONS96_003657 [Cadophora gregata f. sp. sojae]